MKRKSVRGLISNARITTIAVFGWILAQLLTIGIAVILTKFVPKVGNLSRIILIIAIGGFSLVIGSLLSVLLTNRSSQVTQNINRSINKVAAGDYSVLVPKIGDNGDIDRLIDNFNKMVKELNSVAVLRKDFITTFSHEFKTPIVSIKGYAELLRESENLTDEQREYLTVIIDESKHLSTLAERTMLLSKLDSGSVSEANEEFYLDEQLGRCAILLDSQMTAKKINLSFSAEHVKITGKKDLLKEAWTNLLSNAVRYSFDGGSIKLTCQKKDDSAMVTIADNGIGMDEETLLHMYESFYQSTTDGKKDGLGLGLAITKKIIDLSGGTILCASTIGKGTYFTVTLPLKGAKE